MPTKKPTAFKIYLVGLGATLVVYAVYYLRNPGTLSQTLGKLGALEIVLTLVAGLIVTFFGGFWALLNKPRDLHRAFMVGLGWPAVIFATDLGAALDSAESKVDAAGFFPASILASAEDTPVIRGLRLAFAPVTSVAKHRSREVEVKRVEAVRERDLAIKEVHRIEGRVTELDTEIRGLRQSLKKGAAFEADVRRLWPSIREGWVKALERREPEFKRAALRVIETVKPPSRDPSLRILRRMAGVMQNPEIKAQALRVIEVLGSD